MRNIKRLIVATLVCIFATAAQVNASPAINTMNVQGYMKLASGVAVTDGTYNIAYGVFQNGVAIWGKQISTTVTDGLFSASLSGLGTNLVAIAPAPTGMNFNYAAVTLNPALLQASALGGITIRIYAVDPIDGSNPTFDVAYSSVPSAYYSEIAKSVDSGSVSFAGLATAAYASVGGIGSADLLVQFNSAGFLDTSVYDTATIPTSALTGTIDSSNLALVASDIPNLNASIIASGTLSGVDVLVSTLSGTITNGIAQTGTSGISTGTGAIALNGATTISGAATFSSAATFNGNMSQSGSGTFSTGMGAISLNGPVTFSTTALLRGATTISGAATFSSGITTNGTLGITINSGGITVNSGGATFNSGITISSGGLTLGSTSGIVYSIHRVAGTPITSLSHYNNTMVVLTTNNAVLNGIYPGTAGQKLDVYWVNAGTTAGFIGHNNAGAAVGSKIYSTTSASITAANAASGASATFIYLTSATHGVGTDGWYLVSNLP